MTGQGSQKVTHMVMANVHSEASTGAASKKMGGAIPKVVYCKCFRYGTTLE